MLELQNISYQVAEEKGAKEILQDVSLSIAAHSFTVITGPNGGGKSTLAKLIMGIARPNSGRILLDGQDITDWDITRRARAGIGFAFQQPVRFKGLMVRDLIALSAGRPLTTDEACRFLSAVGLCALDYIDRELDASLSGGELKRIEIAMVIARGSRLSVFDEPEAGIDLWSFHNLIRVFEHLRDHTEGAILIISHQERILQIADQLVVLSGGRVEKQGKARDLLPGLVPDASCMYLREESL